jgi:DNA invertase Pin-like site-specific DNA recombinase
MTNPYTNKERENKRIKFAQKRRKGHSIAASSEAAGISPSTYYAWNKNDNWDKDDGWSKDDTGSKG